MTVIILHSSIHKSLLYFLHHKKLLLTKTIFTGKTLNLEFVSSLESLVFCHSCTRLTEGTVQRQVNAHRYLNTSNTARLLVDFFLQKLNLYQPCGQPVRHVFHHLYKMGSARDTQQFQSGHL